MGMKGGPPEHGDCTTHVDRRWPEAHWRDAVTSWRSAGAKRGCMCPRHTGRDRRSRCAPFGCKSRTTPRAAWQPVVLVFRLRPESERFHDRIPKCISLCRVRALRGHMPCIPSDGLLGRRCRGHLDRRARHCTSIRRPGRALDRYTPDSQLGARPDTCVGRQRSSRRCRVAHSSTCTSTGWGADRTSCVCVLNQNEPLKLGTFFAKKVFCSPDYSTKKTEHRSPVFFFTQVSVT